MNEGGIHVPFFATGPDVLQSGTNDTLVQVSDVFSTTLELTGVNVAAATESIELDSQSLLPIFRGTDTADRGIIAERFDNNANRDGRALILDDFPQFKLISFQNVLDSNDTPTYEMFEIGSNGVEVQTLAIPPSSGATYEGAYNALLAKDQLLDTPSGNATVEVNIDLPAGTPPLVNANNGNIIRPINITIGGVDATWDNDDITVGGNTTSAARVNESGSPDQFSVVANFDVAASGLGSGSYEIVVTFPPSRVFTATNTFDIP